MVFIWRRPAWSAAEQCRTSGASVSRIPDSKFYNEDRSTNACPWSDEGSPCPRRSWTLMSCTRAWMKRAGNKVPRSSLAHHASSSSQKDDAWIFRAWPWECVVGVMTLRVDEKIGFLHALTGDGACNTRLVVRDKTWHSIKTKTNVDTKSSKIVQAL